MMDEFGYKGQEKLNLMHLNYSLCFVLLAGTVTFGIAQKDNCNLTKRENGISVYSCPVQGEKIKAIRVELEVEGTPSQYAQIALDVDKYHTWHYKTFDQYIIKRISPSEMIYYRKVDAPWPVSNRDMVSHFSMKQDSTTKAVTVTVENATGHIPKKQGLVRIPYASSKLNAIPISKNRMKISQYLEVDPGGALPAWVVNMFSSVGPYHTFNKLKKKIESDQYEGQNVEFSKDP